MQIEEIEEIEQLINDSELSKRSEGAKLLELVVQLYKKYRIENTRTEEDGDMLLFQWGTYDWGQGNFFEIDLTRQITLAFDDPDEATDSMRQLRVTLKYEPNSDTKKIGEGNQWCHSPDSMENFITLVKSSAAFVWSSQNKPYATSVELGYV
ncbi:MAG: hypothetical protein ACXWIN_04080 [Burkholderiaceae bacterium]